MSIVGNIVRHPATGEWFEVVAVNGKGEGVLVESEYRFPPPNDDYVMGPVEQHAEIVRAALHPLGPTQQWVDANQALAALELLAADTERLRDALRLIADHGHELDGYVLPPKRARAIARAALASPPADTERPT